MPARPLARLIASLQEDPPTSARQAVDRVTACALSQDALAEWVRFDHPPDHGYGRRLVASGPGFEVLVMSWRPGDWSAIHDHGQARWT